MTTEKTGAPSAPSVVFSGTKAETSQTPRVPSPSDETMKVQDAAEAALASQPEERKTPPLTEREVKKLEATTIPPLPRPPKGRSWAACGVAIVAVAFAGIGAFIGAVATGHTGFIPPRLANTSFPSFSFFRHW